MTLPVPVGAQTGSVQPVNNEQVLNLLRENNISLSKWNERPWGSFEVAFSKDGTQFYGFSSKAHGWGFSLEDAAVEVLRESVNDPNMITHMTMIFSQDTLDKLKEMLQN